MSSTVRRAVGFALVGTLALLAPVIVGWPRFPPVSVSVVPVFGTVRAVTIVACVPFLAVTVLSLATDSGPLFDLFALPGDYEGGRLYGLASFCLAVAGLTVVTLQFGMPLGVFAASVLLLVYGNLAEKVVRHRTNDPFVATTAFATAAVAAGVFAQGITAVLTGGSFVLPLAVFLAASGALLAALLRSVLFERDDPLVMLSVALALWLFSELPIALEPTQVFGALVITVVLGYVSYALDAASVTGMLAGVFLALLTVVLGDYGWFAVLVSFFVVGALSTKYRYEEKCRRGLAEDNEGARGSGNVVANSAIALVAVLGAAASPHLGVSRKLFLFAFAGSIAAAMSDTLSSEIGGLFDTPRLITTLEPVPPGTDGGVTWQGILAGLAGAGIVAGIAIAFFSLSPLNLSPLGAAVIVLAGVVGMTADSILGATVEGTLVDNMGVNFLATFVASVVSVGVALAIGVVSL